MSGQLFRAVLAAGAGAVLAIGTAGAAHAQTADDGADEGPNCVMTTEANVPDPITDLSCYDTFGEAITAATGGKVRLRPGQRALTQADLAPQSNTVVGIEYKDANFGGSTLTLSVIGSGFQCTGGNYANWPSMPSGWDNTIGSARSYSSCKSGHFEYTNNGGSVRICGCSSMGTMNDKTSSIRFSASGL